MPVLQAVCEYKNAGGCSIKADVFLPPTSNAPVVLYFHGGALISGSRKYLLNYQRRRLIQAGFAVAAFDYRLAPETKLAEIILDIQDAIAWARTEGAGIFSWNAGRIAAVGGSAGGYLSLMTGTFAQKPDAIVSFYGYGDILADWYMQPSEFYCREPMISKEDAESSVGGRVKSVGGNRRFTYYFYTRQQGTWVESVSGCHPVADREELLRYCPAYRIAPDYPPTLLLHGDQDTDVPFEQSEQMAAALAKQGIEHEFIRMPGAGHSFDYDAKNPDVLRSFERVVDFLQHSI